MPYGVSPDMGGDSKENTAWMEKCVSGVMETGKDKSSAIAICKAQLKKNKGSKAEVIVDADIINKEFLHKQMFIRNIRQRDIMTYAQAEAAYHAFLAKTNFDI